MSGFAVTPGQLHAVSVLAGNTADELRGQLRRLVREVDPLLDGGWQGTASAAFARGWLEWHAGAVDVVAGLSLIERALTATGADYARAEQAALSSAAGLQ